MRHILMGITFLMISQLQAEIIGNVEYHLPGEGKGWKIVNELNGSKKGGSKTIVYAPENIEKKDTKEFFGAHLDNVPAKIDDITSLEKGIQLQFPRQKVTVHVLEKEPQSILYEWTSAEDGQVKFYGLTRTFSSPEGTVTLMYQTLQAENIEKSKPIWMAVLKDAKLGNQAK